MCGVAWVTRPSPFNYSSFPSKASHHFPPFLAHPLLPGITPIPRSESSAARYKSSAPPFPTHRSPSGICRRSPATTVTPRAPEELRTIKLIFQKVTNATFSGYHYV